MININQNLIKDIFSSKEIEKSQNITSKVDINNNNPLKNDTTIYINRNYSEEELFSSINIDDDIKVIDSKESINISSNQKNELKEVLKTYDTNKLKSLPIKTSLKHLDIEKLGQDNITSVSNSIKLDGGFIAGINPIDLSMIGIDATIKISGDAQGTINISSELEKNGKVSINFETLITPSLKPEAVLSIPALASFGANAKGEGGLLITKNYVFDNKNEALKFIDNLGKVEQSVVVNENRKEKIAIFSASLKRTKIVDNTDSDGILSKITFDKALSKQELSAKISITPTKTEKITSLETGKGNKSSVIAKIDYSLNSQTNKKEFSNGEIDLSINFPKISKNQNLDEVVNEMSSRLLEVVEKSNSINDTKISLSKEQANKIVRNGLEEISLRYKDITEGKKTASTTSLPIPFIDAIFKSGSMLNLHLPLEKNTNGSLEIKSSEIQVKTKSDKVLGLSIGIIPFAKINGFVNSKSVKVETH